MEKGVCLEFLFCHHQRIVNGVRLTLDIVNTWLLRASCVPISGEEQLLSPNLRYEHCQLFDIVDEEEQYLLYEAK